MISPVQYCHLEEIHQIPALCSDTAGYNLRAALSLCTSGMRVASVSVVTLSDRTCQTQSDIALIILPPWFGLSRT